MRVAICYSGLVRNFIDCINTHKHFIFDKFQPDVFIHTWTKLGSKTLPHWYNHNYDIEQHKLEINNQENIDSNRIIELYSPKKFLIEFPDIEYFYHRFYCQDNPKFFNNVMMHYGINKANGLKKQYEIEHNYKYDVVIRCRFDLYFQDLVIDSFSIENIINNKTIYLPPNANIDSPFTPEMANILNQVGPQYMPNDQFAYSSSEGMDYYSSIYEIYEKNFNLYIKHPEGVLSEHLWIKNNSIYQNISINDSIKMQIQSRYWT